MALLTIRFLGSFQVELAGEPVTDFATDKTRALLAYLVAEADRPHRREALAGLLWPDYPERSARTSLRSALANLRRAIGDDEATPSFLNISWQTVQFNRDSDAWCDVSEFTELLQAALSSDQTTHQQAVRQLEDAVQLYRGGFLEGFSLADCPAFEEWVLLEREQLQHQVLTGLERLAESCAQLGDYERAVQYARRRVELDPWREDAQRALMRLLAFSGQRDVAIAQYRTYHQLLEKELGVEPSKETQELYGRLLKGDLPVGPIPAVSLRERESRAVGACPYRGLSSFRVVDAAFFFGREGFTRRLFEAVRQPPLVTVIVGSSGSGKSSAAFAGLLPRLHDSDAGGWLIAHFRPVEQPFHALAAALMPALEPEMRETDWLVDTRRLGDALSDGDVLLRDVVERALDKNDGPKRALLLVDQFEELYTLCPDPDVRRRFLDALLAAVGANARSRESRLALLLTLRADFMGQALAHRPFADVLQDSALIMGPMTREELRAAIERPAEKQGAGLEAGLVERLLDDVGKEPGNLPLLEFALTLLWERMDDGWMTHAGYEEIGRVEGALARYAEQVFDGLDEGEREAARRVFLQLVQPGEGTEDTRRVATRAELGEENWALVQYLADKRLVVTGRDPGSGRETVEVAHEALIQRWGQLQAWVEADRAFRTWQERLRVALREWDSSDRDEGALLRGAPLAEAEGWLAERGDELNPSERDFIRAGVALRERRHAERERRRRRIVLALAGGLVLSLLLVLLAGQQWQRAEGEVDARATAEGQARFQAATAEAESVRAQTESEARATQQAIAEEQRHAALLQASVGLASQALSELEGSHPERAVLLALEALENYPYTWQAERALGQAVLKSKLRLILPHEGPVRSAKWSPGGKYILTASDDHTAKVWDGVTGEELLNLPHDARLLSAIWSASGDRVLTVTTAGDAQEWDVSALRQAQGEPSYVDDVTATVRFDLGEYQSWEEGAWSPSGAHVVTWGGGDPVRVWDGSTGELLYILSEPSGAEASSGAWSPAGDQIVTCDDDGTAKIWDTTTGELLTIVPVHTSLMCSASWSSDGAHIVTSDRYGTVKVWDSVTGEEVLAPRGHESIAWSAGWSPSLERFATGGAGSDLMVWDSATGEELLSLHGHTGDVLNIQWSASGERILTADYGGRALVWDVREALLTVPGVSDPGLSDVAWSPTGEELVSGFEHSGAKVWDVSTGAEGLALRHEGGVPAVAWSPSGERILTAGFDGTVKMWDATTGEELLEIPDLGRIFVQWSPDEERFLTTDYPSDGVLSVWDTSTGEQLLAFAGHDPERPMINAAWSPDGTHIVTSGFDGAAKVWDAVTGELLRDLLPQPLGHMIGGVAWSPDGTRIVLHSEDGVGRVLDAATGELHTFTGPAESVWSIRWSPSGDRYLTSSQDGTVQVWDLQTGVELLRYDAGGWTNSAWSPDGTRVAIVSQGTVKVLPAWESLEDLVAYAEECCVVRELSEAEREQFGLPPR